MPLPSRNAQSGFLLMEVLVTIALVGMAIVPIFVLQGNALRALYKTSAQTRMLFPLRNELQAQVEKAQEREDNKEVLETKTIADPAGSLTYKMHKISDDSELKNIPDLVAHEAHMALKSGDKGSMVVFVYQPEKKKKT